jgi:hypothetical protein
MAPLFMGDDEELHALIRDHLIIEEECVVYWYSI